MIDKCNLKHKHGACKQRFNGFCFSTEDCQCRESCAVPEANIYPQLYDAGATREKLASYAHKQWSGWMKYLFSKSVIVSGVCVIPAWLVERWLGQMNTSYEELSEPEKESDRKEADGMLEIICRSFI